MGPKLLAAAMHPRHPGGCQALSFCCSPGCQLLFPGGRPCPLGRSLGKGSFCQRSYKNFKAQSFPSKFLAKETHQMLGCGFLAQQLLALVWAFLSKARVVLLSKTRDPFVKDHKPLLAKALGTFDMFLPPL